MNKNELEKSFDWYLANLQQLSLDYPEKYIAIKDCKVLGAYNSFELAIKKTEKQGHERGTFIVQKASLDPSAYTITHFNNFIGATNQFL